MATENSLTPALVPPPTPEKVGIHNNVMLLKMGFLSTALAYNYGNTAMSALLTYYTSVYGESFFVYVNVAFYGAGLPVGWFQRNFAVYADALLGSNVYAYRLYIWIFISLICLAVCPFVGELELIIISAILGVCTWSAHTTVGAVAGLAKNSCSVYQQVGYRGPAFFCIILLFGMQLNNVNITHQQIVEYYMISLIFIIQGGILWYFVCYSEVVQTKLKGVEQTLSTAVMTNEMTHLKKQIEGGTIQSNNNTADKAENGNATANPMNNRESEMSDISLNDNNRPTDYNRQTAGKSIFYPAASYPSLGARLEASRKVLWANLDLLRSEVADPIVQQKIGLHRRTLFAIAFCSSFQGSFLSYCPTNNPKIHVPVLLFFTRMLGDLSGRMLALYYRNSMFATIERVASSAIVRLILMALYFVYILHPSYKNDLLIILYQIFYSALSGYTTCLTYEYASKVFTENTLQVQSAQLMAISFQYANFCAVMLALIVVIIYENM